MHTALVILHLVERDVAVVKVNIENRIMNSLSIVTSTLHL